MGEIYGLNYFEDRELNWLDIGCGYGEFLETLSQLAAPGSKLRGSEPNLTKKASAQKRGLDVDFYDLQELDEEYSHISLLNVFSHLTDPVGFLNTAKQKLSNGGEILMQTGNGGDVCREEFPGMLFFPDHLLFGGHRSIELVFDKIGMEVVSITKFRSPPLTMLNVAKDLAKRLIRRDHNPVRWRGPFRSLWIRAQKAS
mgnify:CR=1 FL=1